MVIYYIPGAGVADSRGSYELDRDRAIEMAAERLRRRQEVLSDEQRHTDQIYVKRFDLNKPLDPQEVVGVLNSAEGRTHDAFEGEIIWVNGCEMVPDVETEPSDD